MTRMLVLSLVLGLAACAQPEAAPSPTLDSELGVAPTVRETEPTAVASPAVAAPGNEAVAASPTPVASAVPAAPSSPPVTGDSPAPVETEAPTATGDATPAVSSEPIVLLAVSDRVGDHGARGPDWADLRSLELVEIGNDLRVTVRFEGQLPSRPPEGEVPLVGINIGDDGYQLFVEGGGESWAAYLDTPDGFVAYPGTFQLAGRALVLQVPFNAVGSPTRAPVRTFVEWSRDSGTLGVLNPASEDKLDGEPHTFDRNP